MYGVAGVTKIGGVVAAAAFLMLGVASPQVVEGSSQSRWFQVGLATGETNGYDWSIGAKGAKAPAVEPNMHGDFDLRTASKWGVRGS
jgi:hypothetical protein